MGDAFEVLGETAVKVVALLRFDQLILLWMQSSVTQKRTRNPLQTLSSLLCVSSIRATKITTEAKETSFIIYVLYAVCRTKIKQLKILSEST